MRLMLAKRAGVWPFVTLALAVGIAASLVPRTDLPPSYHHFADQRSWLGIPNFGDVVSNLIFLLAGLCGLAFLFSKSSVDRFIDVRERWFYLAVFLGLLLTAFGSLYYHLATDNNRLVLDRVPMIIVSCRRLRL
jgi:hypothetical protein